MKLDLNIRKAASIGAALQSTAPAVRMVPLTEIECDPRLQVRVTLSEEHLTEDLIPKIEDGERLLPVTLGDLAGKLYLTSGFHRVEAHRRLGKEKIEAEILPVATWRDLVALALPTNDDHGLPLTRADRRRKVEMACIEYFDEIAQGRMSDNALAQLCHVAVSLVNDVRRTAGTSATTERTVTKSNGQSYTIDTAKIGRPKMASVEVLAALLDEYLTSLPDEWDVVNMLVAAQQKPPIAATLAERAELPAHKPATLTSAITAVLLRRTVAVYLPRQSAQMLVLLLDSLSASYRDEKDSLLSLIKPQIDCGLGDTTWEIA
jgi:hypothetical protein